ncbi:Crp/Fnr family transcriptional regulator [Flavobacteriaceae bacterium TP-CH-4]|uniref:Crp/Fnr family transcriptional regulator n=1 Tax=Pelagihabitans pacificus TaxID=2696054 RepID=A0A967AYX7_9FLAO|nr:Crp/Fnr family transcriptional regulator [Pelagihabitans pacificus]NHF59111.1 Crp/Fnr family transcriptional regulator [Pelagihabitans pacificus]
MEAFRTFFSRYVDFTPEDWNTIAPTFQKIVVGKGQLLLKEGDISNHLCFLEDGLLRFYLWKDGESVTKFFTEAPYMFTSQRSFNQRQPARESIEALEDSIIWQISYEQHQELLQMTVWKRFADKITQEVQFFTENILEELQNETAEHRYRLLLENRPELVRRVPLKHLASYLGITQQSLSRIRRNI